MESGDFRNPVYAEDQNFRAIRFPKGPAWIESHIVHVDSSDRDTAAYPNANSFALQFREPFKSVFSVELLNMSIPILAVPTPPYLWLVCPQLEHYDVMITTTSQPNQTVNTTATNAFAKIPITVGAGNTEFFRKSELRQIKKFKSTAGRLRVLNFELRNPDGSLYTLPQGGEWTATLEVVAKN